MRDWLVRLSALTLGAILLTSAYYRIPSSTVMTQAAEHFLASLTPEQRAKATFTFQDDERLNWHFIPKRAQGTAAARYDAAAKSAGACDC